jgi:RNA polymerase sigma factor (sigma-70 family)
MTPEDRLAFTRAYDEYAPSVYAFFGYRVRSRSEAEDLTQATFERALRSWRSFEPDRGSERTWLMTIAWNLLIDHYRKDRPSASLVGFDPPDNRASSVVDELVSAELASALDSLGDREREVLALRFGGDLKGPEIARVTGLSISNVHQILSRTLRKLRARLEPVLSPVG